MTGKKYSTKRKNILPMRAGGQEDAAVASATMSPLLPIRPTDVLRALPAILKEAVVKPTNLLTAITRFSTDQLEVMMGTSELEIPSTNERLKDERWKSHGYYRRLAQSWISLEQRSKEWLNKANMDAVEERRALLFLNTILGGLSPANYPITNPEVVDETIKTRGDNLIQGLSRRWDDLKHNHGLPTQVDKSQFEVGKNLAVTPGQVIYRTEMFELIQYTPTTRQVYKTPTLLVPSFVNRAYIVDLKPGRSMVEYMLSQGHSVFLVVFLNPGKAQRHWGIDQYVQSIIDAGSAVRDVTKSKAFNLLGVCAGGQLSILAASVLEARRIPWINSLTMLVYVIDPRAEDTETGVICTEQTAKLAKRRVGKENMLKASELTWSVNLLQPERLIFNTGVEYYLLGKDPSQSEVMFWMNDQNNVAEKLMCEELDMILNNPLPKAGEFKVLDVPVDLKRLKMDTYTLAAYYDHMMPWHSVYRNRNFLGGSKEFVLTNGGHATACITTLDNPRAKYFVNSNYPEGHDEWLEGAKEHTGSWLRHWTKWLAARSSDRVPAPKHAGNRKFQPLCDAPGTYAQS